jgi:hypothetical protein
MKKMILVVLCMIFTRVNAMNENKDTLFKLVTAEKLDNKALTTASRKFDWINGRDDLGLTPSHHLVTRKSATLEQIKFFANQGARFTIRNYADEDVHQMSFRFGGNTPVKHTNKRDFFMCNPEVFSFVHATAVAQRYEERKGSLRWQKAPKSMDVTKWRDYCKPVFSKR